ncbi:MAG: hypothetical protein ACP6IQ_02560 [Candidatus Njordarchaeia archaeon]
MSWNYRVFEVHSKGLFGEGRKHYEIREVYYDNKGKIEAWTAEPMSPFGDGFNDLKGDMRLMFEAFKKPVLRVVDDKIIGEVETFYSRRFKRKLRYR